MADKEATVYIVDVGKSMSHKSNGRTETNFEFAMRYVWDRITTTVATGRKTFLAAVIALKSDETNNELEDDGSYANLNVVQPLSQIQMPELRYLQSSLKPSHTENGDAISAIILAVMMILKECKQLKYKRKIVLVTDGKGQMDTDSIEDITKKIQEMSMELTVLGVDFDDEEFGFKEEGKSKHKAHNEKILRSLVDDCDGAFGTLEAAIQELSTPRVKLPRPVPSFKGTLRLGDPEQYDSAMTIDVERYSRVMIARAPTASSYVVRSNFSQDTAPSSATLGREGEADGSGMAVVRNTYNYNIKDEDTASGKRAIDREELAKGYEYGRTIVHISESDQNITKLETEPALDLMGFVPKEKYERYMSLSQTYIVIAQKVNEKAIIALSSFIHALFELDTYAIARLVTKEGREPQIVLLAPSIEPDYECLIETQLPFAEDVRSYQFPPLDKVITVSGKVLKEHRNLPSKDLLEAMSDFVDSMDLSTLGEDDEGNPVEYARPEDTFSPLLHRLDSAIRSRAIDPKSEITPPAPILMKYSQPPSELLEKSTPRLKDLIKVSDVKKVPPRVKGRKRNRDTDKPLSGLDIDELFRHEKRTQLTSTVPQISPDNAIADLKQFLNLSDSVEALKDLAKQFQKIQEDLIKSSFGDQHYNRVIESLGVLKKELIEYEEPQIWNEILRALKRKVEREELGGDRRELWWLMRKNRLGLLGNGDEEEARKFWWLDEGKAKGDGKERET
ncbi:putative ku family dna [Phaeomoniella chlamydospora]|uniref:ATP-dependent DNA helicase II subunit 2 n=1 Tax=Phaeomoniella chlamydospora TaxID=158046 RepID=A0A0G2E168_PHACM|nr:putative ku family dna [Phaeomoniella chlamydospora]